jgi:hypothetical protein
MYPSVETQSWFRRRNLVLSEGRVVSGELSPEVTAYLLVTLAVRPDHLPVGVVTFLADRFLGHCAGDRQEH